MTTHYARPLWQRLTSALTALVMVLGMLPFTSQAAQAAPNAPSRADLLAEPELATALNAPQAPASATGPGGVDTNLALWLRADEGVTESGGAVSAWADQSTTGTDATQATAGNQPTYVADAMNFNPALHFDNDPNLAVNQFLSFSPSSMPAGADDRTFIVIASRDVERVNYTLAFGYGDILGLDYNRVTLLGAVGPNPTSFDGKEALENVLDAYYAPGDLTWPANTPAIVARAFTTSGANQESYLFYNANASAENPDEKSIVSAVNVSTEKGRIGAHPDSIYWAWDGQIAEVIVYDSALQGTTEMQKIESYLAIKYGITLDQTAPTDYLDSAGAVIWNATTNAAYNSDIAGLGRDDASGLNQLKSKSVNSSATVTVDADSLANDKAFWVWGHDGDAASYTTTGAPIGLEMLERTWKAQRTNIAATDSVTICTSIATADYLLLDADGVFASGAISHTLTSGCASGIDATSGAFFTFARDDTTMVDIYNQDGIGFSGTIPPNPLHDNLMMSSYQNWPAGYNDGAFIGSVFDGENTWLVPYNANQVVKIAPDGTMTEYSDWPVGFTKGLAAFEGGVFDGENVWLVPHLADQLIKVDPNGNMTAYSDWPTDNNFNLWLRSFVGGVFDGQHIWLIPFSASHLVRVDPSTGDMESFPWPAGYFKGFWAFRGGVFDGQNIWLIPYYSTHLIKFNTLDNTMTAYNNWPAGFIKTGAAFAGGVFDGDDLWMIPFYADRVVKFDTTTEQMTGYNAWPTGFFKTLGAFYGGGFDGQYIWMTPATANQVIRINKDDGAMTGYNVWPHDFYKLGRYFYGGSFDGQGMWLAPLIADRAIRLHKVPPAAPIVATPANGSVTNLDPLPFTGTAEPGATVVVSDDQGNVLCTAVADATTGAWSCTPAATGDGSYAFDVVAIDTDGNESDPTNVGVTVDSVNPPLAVTSPVSGTAINTDPPSFTGTTEAGAAITVTDSLNNDLCTATADGSGDWSCTPAALGEGEHAVAVTADDGAGNTSAVPLSFEIDQTAPAAPDITEPEDGATTSLLPTFAGTGEPGGALTLYDAGANPICTTTVAADGSWHCTPATPLTVGAQTLSATVTDAAGNEGDPAEVAITASDDTTAPAAPDVTAPISGTTTGLRPTFEGTGDAGDTITIYDTNGETICTTTVDNDGDWTCPLDEDLEEGDQSYSVTATNAVGIESFPPVEVSLTVAAPVATFCPGGVCADLTFWVKADGQITFDDTNAVDAWDDETGQHMDQELVDNPPTWIADAYNFNPAVRFGNGYFMWEEQQFLSGASAAEIFYVLKARAHNTNDGFPGEFGGGGANEPAQYTSNTGQVRDYFGSATRYDWDPRDAPAGGPSRDVVDLHIYGATSTSAAWSARFNGALNYITTTHTTSFDDSPSEHTYLGAGHQARFHGEIAEVVLYSDELAASDRNKIESYLALKYGVTLSDTLDYVLSDDTVVWDAAANADYYNDVAGIAIDHGSALTQTQSRSINADSLITMGSLTDLSNGEALLWGNNDADATTFDQETGNYLHVARIWKVQVTGDVGAVTVTVAADDAEYILVSDSPDFSSATAYPVGSSIDFVDGQYFTLAQDAPTPLAFCPGGVCAPALWLRANTDITATNDITVTAWADLLGTNTFTVTGDPQLQADALNFNSVVAFDGDGDYLVGDTDITFVEAFAVAQTLADGGRLLAGDGAVPGGCGAYFFMRADVSSLFIGDADPHYAFTMNTPDPDGYRILNGALLGGADASDSRIAVNGAAYVTAGYGATEPLEPFTRAPLVGICGNRAADTQYTGNIAEVIVYENELTDAERQRVDSYLALKYGIALTNTLDYLLSDGTTVV